MEKTTNSVSPVQGTEKTGGKKEDVVFITILREDRDWINKTKGKLNREQRLHEVIERIREEFGVE